MGYNCYAGSYFDKCKCVAKNKIKKEYVFYKAHKINHMKISLN